MVRQEFTYLSADGMTSLHAVQWMPEGDVRTVLQLVHGVAEYILRYEPLAEFLTKQGFAVVGHDHVGHGLSVADHAPRLYFGPRGSWDWIVEDVRTLQVEIQQKFPDVPYFVLGHSMGSFLLRTYLARYPGTVDGAIIMGTSHSSTVALAVAKALADWQVRKLGEKTPSSIAMKLSFDAYNRKFAPTRTPYDWIAQSTTTVDAYLADPLCGGAPTIGLFREMLEGMSIMIQPETVRKMDANLPVLFLSGAMDPVGNCGKDVEKAFRLFLQNGMKQVSMKLYPQLRHEILNEDCREDVFWDILRWLTDHLPT